MKTINIKGPIISNGEKWIYDWFEEDATCPNDVINALPDDGSEVNIMINSNGGYVTQGNEIYTALKLYSGTVNVTIIEAASAAGVIAMAGDVVRITPVGQLMMHNAATRAAGDRNTMRETGELLRKRDDSIASAYQLKTRLPKEEILNMMNVETWLTAEEAKAKGFVDEILFQEELEPQIVASCGEMIPQKIIEKLQNMKNNDDIRSHKALSIEQVEAVVGRLLDERIPTNVDDPNENNVEGNPLQRFFF